MVARTFREVFLDTELRGRSFIYEIAQSFERLEWSM
jgi:hypothetical protein